MISTQQWRAVIGCFCPHRGKPLSLRTICISGRPISIGLRVLLAISLCIVMSGDVETNPGPGYNDVMKELKEFRQANEELLKDLKTEMTSLKKEVTNLRTDLDTVKGRVDQCERDIDTIHDEFKGDMFTFSSRLERIESQIEKQEIYSRRDNLIFHGVPNEENETQTTTQEKIVKLLNDNVPEREWSGDDFVRVHRLRSKQSGQQPVIARFLRTDDRYRVLNCRQQLKSNEVGVSTDLTVKQRDQLNKLKQEGKKGYFKQGKLVVDHRHSNSAAVGTETRPGNAGGQFRFGQGRGRGNPSYGNSHRGDRQHSSSAATQEKDNAVPNS